MHQLQEHNVRSGTLAADAMESKCPVPPGPRGGTDPSHPNDLRAQMPAVIMCAVLEQGGYIIIYSNGIC